MQTVDNTTWVQNKKGVDVEDSNTAWHGKMLFSKEEQNNKKENQVTKELRFSHSDYDTCETVATLVEL